MKKKNIFLTRVNTLLLITYFSLFDDADRAATYERCGKSFLKIFSKMNKVEKNVFFVKK